MAINPERWPEISRLFAAAVALDRPARQAYLDDACHDDSVLRAAVDSLLGAHEDAGSFGESPTFALGDRPKRLTPGSQLGPFRIEVLLGAGGMGEVYRASDTKLKRAVAIKVLPDTFANDPDRRARFEDEARALAALNHPHIGAIYGVEESQHVVALVLELVEGPTLAERLAAGPMAVDEVLWVARQLAEGLEAAHDRGIVHRDLKPANIKIAPEGNVKILDFGLAKPDGSQARPASPGSSPSSPHATRLGVIVGTAGYMSPEQARGQLVDKRTDIWAFGCVLFEICAQRPPFTGASVAETLTAVIEREPDWASLPVSTPPSLVRLLHRCLTKDSKLRLRDIGEARIALASGQDADAPAPPARRSRKGVAIGLVAGALVAATWLGVAFYPRTPASSIATVPVRFVVPPPEGTFFGFHPGRVFFALSPDGSKLALLASTDSSPFGGDAGTRIYLRTMGDLEARPLPGTEGATAAFWSPDGRSLAFFADGRLKRVDLPGGAPVTICDLPNAAYMHGTWGSSGVILMANGNSTAIKAVPAAGGTPRDILALNPANHEMRVHWPWFLADGKRFLYTARLDDGEGELRIGDLDGQTRLLMRGSSNAQWVDPGTVVFVREGVLMAQRVDPNALQPVGEPFAIASRVEYFFTTSRAMFSTSRTGTVAYHPGGDLGQYHWFDRAGRDLGAVGSPGNYEPQSLRLSSDGYSLLTARAQPGFGTFDIWRLDIARQTEERLTDGRGSEITPAWIDGGRAIVYAGDSAGSVPHLFRKDLTSATESEILPPGHHQLVMDVLAGGTAVAYAERSDAGRFSLLRLPLTSNATPSPLLPSAIESSDMRVSPDGRAIAFVAFNGSRVDLYVTSMPMTSAPVLAAAAVQGPPRWSADSRELFYLASDRRISTIPVRTMPSLSVGMPRSLFAVKPSVLLGEVSSDGRLVLLVPTVRAGELPVVVSTALIEPSR